MQTSHSPRKYKILVLAVWPHSLLTTFEVSNSSPLMSGGSSAYQELQKAIVFVNTMQIITLRTAAEERPCKRMCLHIRTCIPNTCTHITLPAARSAQARSHELDIPIDRQPSSLAHPAEEWKQCLHVIILAHEKRSNALFACRVHALHT